jgi:hypothetical protein
LLSAEALKNRCFMIFMLLLKKVQTLELYEFMTSQVIKVMAGIPFAQLVAVAGARLEILQN